MLKLGMPPDSNAALDLNIPPALEFEPPPDPGTLLDPTAPPDVHNKPQYHTSQLYT